MNSRPRTAMAPPMWCSNRWTSYRSSLHWCRAPEPTWCGITGYVTTVGAECEGSRSSDTALRSASTKATWSSARGTAAAGRGAGSCSRSGQRWIGGWLTRWLADRTAHVDGKIAACVRDRSVRMPTLRRTIAGHCRGPPTDVTDPQVIQRRLVDVTRRIWRDNTGHLQRSSLAPNRGSDSAQRLVRQTPALTSAFDEVLDINRLRLRRPYALIFETDTFVRWKMWFVFPIPE